MKYYVKDEPDIVINAHTAISAAIKLIRRIVRNRKIKNVLEYNKNENLVLSDINKKDYYYIFTIKKNTENKMTCKYYTFDYKIELYKKMSEK